MTKKNPHAVALGKLGGPDFDKEQFWAGLARLYDETLALKQSIAELRLVAVAQAERATAQAETAKAHESRLDKLEVVQQWLAEKERTREKERGQ